MVVFHAFHHSTDADCIIHLVYRVGEDLVINKHEFLLEPMGNPIAYGHDGDEDIDYNACV